HAPVGFVDVSVDASGFIYASIADSGIGIYKSLRESVFAPKSEIDAITLAIREGVTRDSGVGQGNGLWGLARLVEQNGGSLTITSGESQLLVESSGNVGTTAGLVAVD